MYRKAEKSAMRGMRSGAEGLRAQGAAYAKASAESDRERAQETARELLLELGNIETELKRDLTAKT